MLSAESGAARGPLISLVSNLVISLSDVVVTRIIHSQRSSHNPGEGRAALGVTFTQHTALSNCLSAVSPY